MYVCLNAINFCNQNSAVSKIQTSNDYCTLHLQCLYLQTYHPHLTRCRICHMCVSLRAVRLQETHKNCVHHQFIGYRPESIYTLLSPSQRQSYGSFSKCCCKMARRTIIPSQDSHETTPLKTYIFNLTLSFMCMFQRGLTIIND